MQTFNRLAREVDSDRKEHGSSFEKTFKKKIDEEVAISKKSEKRESMLIPTMTYRQQKWQTQRMMNRVHIKHW